MIKLVTFNFEVLEFKEDYWVHFAHFGSMKSFDVKQYSTWHDVDLRLNDGKCYQVGFDQSTACTGIIIKSYDNSVVYLMEISRKRGIDADDFMFDFERLMHKIFEGALISHLIYEAPITSESFRSSQVLFQLEGMIRMLPKRYDEFRTVQLDNIENSSWRRVCILQEYKNRDRKIASMLSMQTVFPWCQGYGASLGKDNDVFEAMGVLFGWFLNSYDELGRPYVRGERYRGLIGGFIMPTVSAEQMSIMLKAKGIENEWFMQNPRKSIYDNLACAVKKYKVVCVELTSPSTMLALTMECNIKWVNPDKMVVILVAANYSNTRLFEITGKEYHFVI